MASNIKEISLDLYWNQVATPFFLIVLGFGLYILFSMSDSLVGAVRGRLGARLAAAAAEGFGDDDDNLPPRVEPPAAAQQQPPPQQQQQPPPPAAAPQGGGSRRRRSHR